MKERNRLRTRFAPSPTGHLHLGHGYAAVQIWDWAARTNATVLLRIEDIDQTRCRPAFVTGIFDDLHWLEVAWPTPVMVQSQRMEAYHDGLDYLHAMGVLYPCFCSRREIAEAQIASAPHGVPPPYPGTCRGLTHAQRIRRMQETPDFAWRIDTKQACQHTGALQWTDFDGHTHDIPQECLDDFIVARKDIALSYHLAVVLDDAAQGISHIIRGDDLRDALAPHRLLQALLGFTPPLYHHHALVHDAGKRLAKRHDSLRLSSLRKQGWEASDVIAALRTHRLHEISPTLHVGT
ncbi:MAG: tRNA glutamyl-Q(34) synthetase GluQRS [Pseudomonadota bacterium]